MTIKIVKIIFVIIIIYLLTYLYKKWKICISNDLNDFKKMINNKSNINTLFIRNFYPEHLCDVLLNRINKIIINKRIENWKYSETKGHDVNIFQIPLSYVFNNMKSHKDYLNQGDYGLYNNIISPLQYFKRILKNKLIDINIGYDKELAKYINKNNKNLFQEGIVRIYNKNDGGLWHVDIDDSNMYKDYKIYSINIYLKTPPKGGRLKIHNKILSPKKGDMIIFDPSYYHCVEKCNSNNRISIQSFLLYNSKKDYIMIRG